MATRGEALNTILFDFIVEKKWKRWLWTLLALALTIYVAYLVRAIWVPLALAFLIAMVLDPVVDRMEHRGWSRQYATIFIFTGFLVVVGGLLFLGVPRLIDQGQSFTADLNKRLPDRSPKGIDKALTESDVHPTVRAYVARAVAGMDKAITGAGNWLGAHSLEIMSNVIWIVIIPIVAFYALRDFHLILAKGLLLVPKERREFVQTMVGEVTAIFAKYMRALGIVCVLNGIATWLLLLILGVPNALVLGVIAGVLYAVPYIGAIVTIILVAIAGFLAGGPTLMLWVVIANIVLHQIVFDQIISPRVLGGHVGLHPILSIIALLVGNAVLGLIGMVLAVPVAACIQIAVLAVVPKLAHEINIPDAETSALADDIQETHLRVDATEELHRSVTEAVENVEAEAAKADA